MFRISIILIILILPFFAMPPLARMMYPVSVTTNYAEGATIRTTTGYTIFQRSQVKPKYVLVSDETGSMEYLNPGPTPDYPATFGAKLCYSNPFNLYSASNTERLEVWEDMNGTATVHDVLTVCPQFRP